MMHDDEVRVGVKIARRLISDQFPHYAGERIEPLRSGTDNAIFRIGSDAAARFPLRAGGPLACTDALGCEAVAMEELVRHCPVPTPRPIGLGQPGLGYPLPWAVQSWVEGDIATSHGLSTSQTFALDLAGLIEALRSADTRGRPFDGRGRGGSLRDHDQWMATCLEKSEKLLDVQPLRRLWARFRDLPVPPSLAMCHRDLIPANLLVDGERLAGVLDGGGFGPADPALDLVAAWHLLERDQRETLRTHLGSGKAEWLRGAAWAFQQAMGLVWYYQRTHSEMSDLGRSTLTRIIDDPDIRLWEQLS